VDTLLYLFQVLSELASRQLIDCLAFFLGLDALMTRRVHLSHISKQNLFF
jgi:hypothetical protein